MEENSLSPHGTVYNRLSLCKCIFAVKYGIEKWGQLETNLKSVATNLTTWSNNNERARDGTSNEFHEDEKYFWQICIEYSLLMKDVDSLVLDLRFQEMLEEATKNHELFSLLSVNGIM